MAKQRAVQPHIVEEILGHRTFKQGVPGRYNKAIYAKEVRNALLAWEDYVRSLPKAASAKFCSCHRRPLDDGLGLR